jgi:hypothetical protein
MVAEVDTIVKGHEEGVGIQFPNYSRRARVVDIIRETNVKRKGNDCNGS